MKRYLADEVEDLDRKIKEHCQHDDNKDDGHGQIRGVALEPDEEEIS